MSKYLMTQSLLNSWLYVYKAHEDYSEAAYGEFLQTLNKISKPPNEAMLAGINFEDAVNAVTAGKIDPAAVTDSVRRVAEIVQGGQPQVALYRNKTIAGIDFLLYGRLDYLKAGTVYDIKFSKNYEVGKFYESIQRPFYFGICPEALWFEYLISDGRDVFSERYGRSDDSNALERTITEFMEFLRSRNLLHIYFDKWQSKS